MTMIDADDINFYQVQTEIQLNAACYNTALNQLADPTSISLFIEDPSGNITTVPSNQIVRAGTGTYYSIFLPSSPGLWTYKWQGSGNVVATSKDTQFYVQGSAII